MLVRDVDLASGRAARAFASCARTPASRCSSPCGTGGYVVYVDKVDSPQPIKAMTSIGSRVPATVVSTGKALLAWMAPEALDSAMEHVKRYTPLTMTRRKDIEHDLEETRERGYAVNRGEFRVGVGGIAAPVRDRSGGVVASIAVWGSEKNDPRERCDELAAHVGRAARDISREMGFVEAPPAKAPASEATEA